MPVAATTLTDGSLICITKRVEKAITEVQPASIYTETQVLTTYAIRESADGITWKPTRPVLGLERLGNGTLRQRLHIVQRENYNEHFIYRKTGNPGDSDDGIWRYATKNSPIGNPVSPIVSFDSQTNNQMIVPSSEIGGNKTQVQSSNKGPHDALFGWNQKLVWGTKDVLDAKDNATYPANNSCAGPIIPMPDGVAAVYIDGRELVIAYVDLR